MKAGLQFLIFFLLVSVNAYAEVKVIDAAGNTVNLERPAHRVISLSPHLTELLYAAGATRQVVAAVEFSDYPEQARQLPRIGRYDKFDLESIIALDPDLVLAWKTGNPHDQVQAIEKLGFTVYYSEPRNLEDVAADIRKLGRLLGTEQVADQAAERYLDELTRLRNTYRREHHLEVFYQVWSDPLFTVNKEHIISQVIDLCGGKNVFGDLQVLSPRVSIEAVLEKNPEVILVGMASGREQWLDEWKRWPTMKAVRKNQVYPINADLIVRHTPRILEGAVIMCEYLQSL